MLGSVLHDPNSVWFWVSVSLIGAILLALLSRLRKVAGYVARKMGASAKEWIREVMQEEVLPPVQAVKDAVGETNGSGSATTMLERILQNQLAGSAWAAEHDRKDDERYQQTHGEVRELRGQMLRVMNHLGLEPREHH